LQHDIQGVGLLCFRRETYRHKSGEQRQLFDQFHMVMEGVAVVIKTAAALH
jgi:hypothetical protein